MYRRGFHFALICLPVLAALVPGAGAAYQNFESSHVHPIAITPSGTRLLAVNTPDAMLEIFAFDGAGNPIPTASVPVGLEPVSVVVRSDSEAWVVNSASGTISIVSLSQLATVRTLPVGKLPTDVAFAAGKAFVALSNEDVVKVFDLANLAAAPQVVGLFARKIRALAPARDGSAVYAVAQESGNQTTVVDANVITSNNANLNTARLAQLGVNNMTCATPPPPYPPLPGGIVRNPDLIDPPDGIPKVGLIVRWDQPTGTWRDEANQNWTSCLPFRLPDHDLFAIDATTLAVTTVDHLGTTLFDVSVNPQNGKIYVPNTDARNIVRFEHPLGVRGHVVDNRLTIVNPAAGNSVTLVDLNTHINRASDPATNLAERSASISQPGMMTWKSDGSVAYLTAIGSRKLFVVDGACATGACIFGPNRATPRAVDVGEGPTGVALLESRNRLYVLNRFSNSVAVVDVPALVKVAEIPLHDPSPQVVRTGRKFLYDGVLSSGHGDAACSSCHISGDKDGITWDLGDPTGTLTPYSAQNDNVRFVAPSGGGQPVTCDASVCASHAGFDPQKGPMATQTLRGMLEPLHWRGDRPTMNDFNPAFVNLLGAHDIGPINGKAAGLSASDMETFRQLALAIPFPANPNRNVDDTIPNVPVLVPGLQAPGNPTHGQTLFGSAPSDANQPCTSCHTLSFGAGGGRLFGVTPAEPASPDTAALFNGNADQSPHSDLKISHLRNIWDKPGFVFGPPGGPFPDVKTGFGLVHDGAVPNLFTFLSFSVFNLTAADVRDIASFVLHFSTGTRPAVGGNVTVPQGTPPTGSAADESLLATLLSLGDAASSGRHCELTASAMSGGRIRSYRWTGGSWRTDVVGEAPLSTATLRQGVQGPITFLCAPVGSGIRLGGDRDEDMVLNGNDCAPADSGSWAAPFEAGGFSVNGASPTQLLWIDQSTATGPGLRYAVVGGLLSALRASGLPAATSCVVGGLQPAAFLDPRPVPPDGDGYFYLVRGTNACAVGTLGPGRSALDTLACTAP